jgi:hypothetical protein
MVLYLDTIAQTDVDIGYINISMFVCIVNHHFDVNLIFSKLRTKQFLKKSLEFNVA